MFAISICANGYSQNKSRTNVTAKTSKSQKRIVKKDVRKKQAFIKFENTDYDFGKVKAGQTKSHTFKFKNIGNANLVIIRSNVYCSCMKVTIPSEPIKPDQTGEILLEFTGEQLGSFMKNAQIYTNCENPMIRLNIEGEVIE